MCQLLPHDAEQRTEDAREQSAAGEQHVEILLDVRAAVLHAMERAIDRHEDEQVHHRDGEQEQRRHRRADRCPPTSCHDASLALERRRRRGDGDRREHDDGRVAEREEEAGRRPAAARPASAFASRCRSPRCGRRRWRGAGQGRRRAAPCRAAADSGETPRAPTPTRRCWPRRASANSTDDLRRRTSVASSVQTVERSDSRRKAIAARRQREDASVTPRGDRPRAPPSRTAPASGRR